MKAKELNDEKNAFENDKSTSKSVVKLSAADKK